MTAIINPALPASPPTSGISRYAHQIGQGVRVLVPVTVRDSRSLACRSSDGISEMGMPRRGLPAQRSPHDGTNLRTS